MKTNNDASALLLLQITLILLKVLRNGLQTEKILLKLMDTHILSLVENVDL